MSVEKLQVYRGLKTAKGVLEGVIKMLEDERYCIDISHQILACSALLKKANQELLSNHLQTCVKDADDQVLRDQKLKEIDVILAAIMK